MIGVTMPLISQFPPKLLSKLRFGKTNSSASWQVALISAGGGLIHAAAGAGSTPTTWVWVTVLPQGSVKDQRAVSVPPQTS